MDDYDWYTAHKYQSHIPADSRYYTPAQVAAIKQAERRRCAKLVRLIGADWHDSDQRQKWYAADYLAKQLEDLKD